MFARSFKKSFEQWWTYYFLKGLYDYSDEQLKEYTDYKPGTPDVERVKNRWYLSLKNNSWPQHDETNDRE